MFINDFDLLDLIDQLPRLERERPNTARAVGTPSNLVGWTNSHSDGWAYWPKPQRAASGLTDRLYRDFLGRYDARGDVDLTDAELTAYLRPIKAFLTRQKVPADQRDLILA